jgi:short-subunit dehydrogenase
MVILIPGASGGFGRVLAEHLASEGHTVYGTMRDPSRLEGEASFPMLAMEITDAASVEACVGEVLKREGCIDVLVNCVNRMIIGGFEEQSVEDVKALYDTNVFGVVRMCQAVLPAMREQGGGTIVNMSPLGGLLAVPTMSAYTSAKFALEALSEALYHEVKSDGIDVVIMEPVAMAMDRPGLGSHLELVAGVTPDSKSHKMLARMEKDTAASGLTPQAVAEKIADVIRREKKPLRVPMDRAKALTWVRSLAPQGVIDRLIGGLLQ